jgi:uncharacterized repeat protein (TIGR03803 family)
VKPSQNRKQPPHRITTGLQSARGAAISILLVWPTIPAAHCGVLTTLYSFENAGQYGRTLVAGLVHGKDGHFYGTTLNGGRDGMGTVFRLTGDGIWTTLYSFSGSRQGNIWFSSGSDGDEPHGGLVEGADGNFYGTTLYGGYTNLNNGFGYGTVFRMTPSGALTTLHRFSGDDGFWPQSELIENESGTLYGITGGGGRGQGTVFSITTNGVLTTLHAFSGRDDGGAPDSALILARDGNLYGATSIGGASRVEDPLGKGYGTVFKITAVGELSTLWDFSGKFDGAHPNGLVIGADGAFYGTASAGGDDDAGTVFKISDQGAFTRLYSFSAGTDGANPSAALVEGADGSFYGTTRDGGDDDSGTVFQLSKEGLFRTLASFRMDYINGTHPEARLLAADGSFYGTTVDGGFVYSGGTLQTGFGTVFKISANGDLRVVYALNGTSGSVSGVLQGSDGYLYGTTVGGGANNDGTVFRFETEQSAIAWPFMRSNGASPAGRLLMATDGNFYGTTIGGGVYGSGTVFKIARSRFGNDRPTTLFSFSRTNGSAPLTSLVQGKDGRLYGTTAYGGSNNSGTVFRISTNGIFESLVSFGFLSGEAPLGDLLEDADGNFYGTTFSGGIDFSGTVFKVTTSGALTILTMFDGDKAAYPAGGLVHGSDSSLYGTTVGGGRENAGTVFRISPTGTLRILHSFSGEVDGAHPVAGLTIGENGSFYGTTAEGGKYGFGIAFGITTNGVLTILHSFDNTNDGANPVARLSLGSDGALYGTTTYGSVHNNGTIFRLSVDSISPRPLFQSIMRVGDRVALTWTAEPGKTYQLQFTTKLDAHNWNDLGGSVAAVGNTATGFDGIAPDQRRFYRVFPLP